MMQNLTPNPSPLLRRGEIVKPARCPQCGAVADGLHIADGRLRAGTVIVTGWACGCGKVVHFGARDNKAVAK